MDAGAGARIAKIILLHGTWGRGAFRVDARIGSGAEDAPGQRWFERGAAFRTRLEKGIGALPPGSSVRWFAWSGANSVFERDAAAAVLADELRADLQDPLAVPVIVAHSHGGNVALRALSRIDDAHRVTVVTMATPFLRVFAREAFELSPWVWWLLFVTITGLLFGAVALPVAYVLDTQGRLPSGFGAVLAALGVLALVTAAFTTRWIATTGLNPRARPETRLPNRAHEIAQACASRPLDATGPAMLVIRGVDDEAALSLAAGAIGAGVNKWLLLVALPILPTPIVLAAMALGGRVDALMPFALTAVAFASLVFLLLAALCKAAFGREFVRTAFVCEIAADSTPDASARIESVTLSPVGRAASGLRHSIYEHPRCADEAARFIRAALR